MVASWSCTLQEDLPRALQVKDPWDCVPESLFLLQPPVADLLDELWRHWRSQHLHSPRASNWTQFDNVGTTAILVPSPCATVCPPQTTTSRHHTAQMALPPKARDDVPVIQECKQFLAIQHVLLRFSQRVGNGEAEEEGHQQAVVSAHLVLPNFVAILLFILPHITGRVRSRLN